MIFHLQVGKYVFPDRQYGIGKPQRVHTMRTIVKFVLNSDCILLLSFHLIMITFLNIRTIIHQTCGSKPFFTENLLFFIRSEFTSIQFLNSICNNSIIHSNFINNYGSQLSRPVKRVIS